VIRALPAVLFAPLFKPLFAALLAALLAALALTACSRPPAAEAGDEHDLGDPGSTAVQPAVMLVRDMLFHGKALHLREAGPADGRPVLLLHGQAFHSGTWEELGTLTFLAERGLRVVAVDVPGFGASAPAEVDRDTFLEDLIPALGLERPMIVAPSMGGVFAFPYVAKHAEHVAGFVAVAPAGSADWAPRLGASDVPALIVWGTADEVFPVSGAEELAAAFQDARLLLLDGARHPAYLDRPEEFHAALAEFVADRARGR
jgi:abhydrolase domain-containing protein 14